MSKVQSLGEILTVVVKGLVDHPENVVVKEQGQVDTVNLLIIHTDPTDVGKVLGKKGSTLELLRELAKKVAAARKQKVLVEIDDPKGK